MKFRFTFGLRSLLIAVLISCIAAWYVGVWLDEAAAQRAAVREIEAAKGFVVYDYQVTADDRLDLFAKPTSPDWLTQRIGKDAVADVTRVSLTSHGVFSSHGGYAGIYETEEAHAQAIARCLRDLDSLQSLRLVGAEFSDTWLNHITELTILRDLYLSGTSITNTGISRLRLALPECEVHH